jgi:hypothetical protein
MVALLKYTLTVFLLFAPLTTLGELCDRIPFKKHVHLPKEKIHSSRCGPRSFFLPRSPGSNTARHLAGWTEYLPGCDDRVWGNLSLTAEYTRSFHSERLAQYLFGSTCLHFSGSQVLRRGPRDLLADNFGLPTTFQGTICFKPRIDNIILDVTFHIGLDDWFEGLYFKTYFPIVTTRWDLGLHCNEVNNTPKDIIPQFPACYMSKKATPAVQNIREALSGTATFGDMKDALMFGRFACDRLHETGIADIEAILGWNPILTSTSHAGLYLITVIPASNTPKSSFIFEPIVGNGDLWEFGIGSSLHATLFQQGYHSLQFYFEGHVTHQFKKFHVRSFDIQKSGPLSRYLLLKEFDDNGVYQNMLITAIDFTTHAARVGSSVKIDASAKFSYFYGEWGFDIGYNIYSRSKEKIKIEPNLFPSDLNNRNFGIKGTEGVCARIFDTVTGTLTDRTVPLNSTQSNATITSPGTTDNPAPITDLDPGEIAITWDSSLDRADLKQVFNSNPPVFVTINDLSLRSAAVPLQLTHKIFAHLSYVALNCPWEPQLGLGGEAEFDGKSKLLSSLNQWGVWFKLAFAY